MPVSIGQNTATTTVMKLAKVEAALVVTGDAAVLDTRRVATGALIDQAQLTSIPTSRDPWAVLNTVPGVQTDRVNVGGNESGQQSQYTGKGTVTQQNVWNIDGVTITDMAATGSSNFYYDFDSIEEFSATTGGSDITTITPGVQLNLVTKRGTNDVHGSARVLLTDQDWQSDNLSDEARAAGFLQGNKIDQVQDYGIEVGGPLLKDHLWGWFSYGRNQIDLFTPNGASDKTTLEDLNGKLNAQYEGTSGAVTYNSSDKIKIGRDASLTRPPETSWNQRGIGDRPTFLWKGELNQVASSTLFATAQYSYVKAGFELVPQGGLAPTNVYQDERSVWHNSYRKYETARPQHQIGANGSYFLTTGKIGHEFKVGFNYRTASVQSTTTWPGNGNIVFINPNGNNRDLVRLTRSGTLSSDQKYTSVFLSDTLTTGRLTIAAGIRYDLQRGNNLGSVGGANPTAPDVLPAINGVDGGEDFQWKDFSPRLGITYALGPQNKVVLKASYARFVDQLGSGLVSSNNASQLASVDYYLKNRYTINGTITRDQIDFASGVQGFAGFNPADPTAVVSSNRIDSNFKSGKTDEIVVGGGYELLQGLGVELNYTYRHYTDAPDQFIPIVNGRAATDADFEFKRNVTGTLKDGTAFSVPLYGLKTGLRSTGTLLSNRQDFSSNYHGVDLNFQKRLADKWMVRGSLGFVRWTQNVGANSCAGIDPTNQRITTAGFTASCKDGDIIAPRSSGSGAKGNVFINSNWQFSLSGLYQLPLGFNIGANVFGRQGYPQVNWISANPGDGLGSRLIIIGDLDSYRLDNVYNVDLRLDKVVDLKALRVTLSAEVFNLFNGNTALQRQGAVQTPTNPGTNQSIQEIQSPRVARFGARISF